MLVLLEEQLLVDEHSLARQLVESLFDVFYYSVPISLKLGMSSDKKPVELNPTLHEEVLLHVDELVLDLLMGSPREVLGNDCPISFILFEQNLQLLRFSVFPYSFVNSYLEEPLHAFLWEPIHEYPDL